MPCSVVEMPHLFLVFHSCRLGTTSFFTLGHYQIMNAVEVFPMLKLNIKTKNYKQNQ